MRTIEATLRVCAGITLTLLLGCPDSGKPTIEDTAGISTDDGDDTGSSADSDADADADGDGDADADADGDDTGVGNSVSIQDIQTHVVDTGSTVTLENVVVTSVVSPSNLGFFIADAAGGPNSGLWVYIASDPDIAVNIGDLLSITGVVSEFAPDSSDEGDTGSESPALSDFETQTQLTLESADFFAVLGSGPVPSPSVVTGATLEEPEAAEIWEGVVVQLAGVTVTSEFGSGDFTVSDGTGEVVVGDLFDVEHEDFLFADTFSSITGPLYFHEGAYKVEPRTEADLSDHADTCGSCEADLCADGLAVGDLVISELMWNPSACGEPGDDDGEYVEVYNNTAGSVDLNCLKLQDDTPHVGYIEGRLVVEAGGYAYLERDSDTPCFMEEAAAAGAVVAHYRSAVSLNQDGDTISLAYEGTIIDQVAYETTADWAGGEGVAMSLDPVVVTGGTGAELNDDMSNWCDATDEIGTTGDQGTPGAANGTCSTGD